MLWRDKIARFFGLGGDPSRPSGVKPWPADDIDPIEEQARIINGSQAQDARDEGRYDELARFDPPKPIKAANRRPPSRAALIRALSVKDYSGRRGGM
jgi:hypothetical protein